MPKKTHPVADAAGQSKKRLRPAGCPAAPWQPGYLAALATTGVYQYAAAAASVNTVTVWRERKRNPDFAAKEKESLDAATLLLEGEAVRRATHGLRRYKFNRDGSPIMDPETGAPYFELEFSDTLLLALLKARLPEVYREKVGLEHSGTVTHKHLTLAEFQQRMKEGRE